jgi:plastocyanin
MRRLASICLAVLTLCSLAATGRAQDIQTVDITAGSYYFNPDTITVKAGQPVTLNVRNEATLLPHNLIINAPEAGIDVKIDVRAGKSASATFTPTAPGTYDIYCGKEPPFGKSHRDRGMHGRLIVE